MTRTTFACIPLFVVFVAAIVFASQDDTEVTSSLKAAVEDFNQTARADSIGKAQPPLTEDEVIAAIRGWNPARTPVDDDIYAQFQRIAESRQLPKGAELYSTTGWRGYRGFHFTVWWINLSIKTGENTGYGFRIRDRKISSRKMTPEELAEAERAAKERRDRDRSEG